MEKIKVMRDWLQSEYHMSEEVHNIISGEVDNSMVEGIALIIHRLSEMPWTTQKDLLDAFRNDIVQKIHFGLVKQTKIKEVLYPHKQNAKNYKMWKKYYSGATGLLSIVIKARNKSSVLKFVNKLELFGIGYSWGGFESLAIYHNIFNSRNFYKFGKDEHLVRIHVGLEDPQDLINDLKQSLKFIK